CVLGYMGQAPCEHWEPGRRDALVKRITVALKVQIESQTGSISEVMRLPLDGIGKAELIEDARSQLGDDAPNGDHHVVEASEQARAAVDEIDLRVPVESSLHPGE